MRLLQLFYSADLTRVLPTLVSLLLYYSIPAASIHRVNGERCFVCSEVLLKFPTSGSASQAEGCGFESRCPLQNTSANRST